MVHHRGPRSDLMPAAEKARLARDRHLDSTLLDPSVYDTRWRLAGYGAGVDKRFGFVPVGKDGERIV